MKFILVALQIAQLCERLSGTRVKPTLVFSRRSRRGARTIGLLAKVPPLVGAQVAKLGEGLRTARNGADVGFFAGVAAVVYLQMGELAEGFRAGRGGAGVFLCEVGGGGGGEGGGVGCDRCFGRET